MCLLAALVGVAPVRGQQPPPQTSLPFLTRVEDVRQLPPEEAQRGYPVRLRAVVTYYHPEQQDLFVQDETGGIYVDPRNMKLVLHPGDFVEVDGTSGPGDFASEVTNPRLRILGQAPLPSPLRISGEELASGRQDSQWIEVEGVVRSVAQHAGRLALDVASGTMEFKAYIPNYQPIPPSLIDARVRIRGVCGGIYNSKNQFIGVEVLIPSLADVSMEQQAPGNIFSLPVRPIHILLRFTPQGAFSHRVRVQGVVTLQRLGRSLFIHDGKEGLLVKTTQLTPLQLGDRVDVVGFPAAGDYTPVMENAVYGKIGGGQEPTPSAITPKDALGGAYDAELVRISGRLLDRDVKPGQETLVLQSDDLSFKAEIEEAAGSQALDWLRPGSLLQLTGICGVQVDENREPVTFRILLRSPEDVVVLARAPWLTVRSALSLLGLMAVIILVALAWAAVLRRRVRKQTGIMRQRFEKEAALEERFQYVARATNDAVWDWDLLTDVVWWNEGVQTIFGYPAGQVGPDASWWYDHIHPEDRGRVVPGVHRVIGGGEKNWSDEYRYRRADGSYAHVFDRGYVIHDEQGKPVRMIGAMMDITERKRMEESLGRERNLLRTLIDNMPDYIYAKDVENRFLVANGALARRMGAATGQDLLGKTDFDFYPREVAAKYASDEQNIMRSGQPVISREESTQDASGKTLWLLTSEAPFRDAAGNVVGLVGIGRDITDRKAGEEAILKAKEAAEAASRTKSEFLANMSHEIRTPMNGILGMTELALGTDLSPEQHEYLAMVKDSADSLLTIINDILDFSKVEAGKLDLEPIEFNLRDSLEETTRTLALRAHQKGLELICDVRPNVPETMVGDPTRLRQIVVNLVGNAIKFTEHGEVVLKVEAESIGGESPASPPESREDVVLHFTIRDTGIGIPFEKQKLIFEAFSQADGSTTRKFGGTGLGLTISSRLVEMMGGRMWVESEVGQGSHFHFTAPLRAVLPAPKPRPAEKMSLLDIPVLVVDDNGSNGMVLKDLLSRWGMKPTVAHNGRTALIALRRAQDSGSSFRLMLADAHMPEMDGFTLIERIRQEPRVAPLTIVMLTSGGQRGDAARCRELGVAAYLTKPVRQAELCQALLSVLGAQSEKGQTPVLVTRHSLREGRRGLWILLAEDNPVNQRLAVRLLEKRGHSVVVAGNGREALESLGKGSFDVVLMDVQMPEMDGLAATATIREREKKTGIHLPIIAMTAHAMKGDRERCLAAGMDGYISKPIRPEELFEVLDGYLGQVTAPSHADLEEPAEGKEPVEASPVDEG